MICIVNYVSLNNYDVHFSCELCHLILSSILVAVIFFFMQKMDPCGKGDNLEEQSEGGGPVTWNSLASTFMLNYLADMVANGTRTSSGFKKVHLNMCARALNDHFKKITMERTLKTI